MPIKGLASSDDTATRPSAGTGTERPAIRCCVPEAPAGARSVTVKVLASPGLARGAMATSVVRSRMPGPHGESAELSSLGAR